MHREIIVATYFHRRTPQEAARQLRISPAEARALLYEAMSALAGTVRPDRAGELTASGRSSGAR